MHRVVEQFWCIVLLIGSLCYAQSAADLARENRKHKGAANREFSSDDLHPTEVIQLLPGSSSTGQGTVVAPGRGKHNYRIVRLDASRFANGGTLHITITVGEGTSEASFDLYPQGLSLPEEGFPNSLAHAWSLPRASGGKINYRFTHGAVFLLAAEGSWNSKVGATNTYSFVVDVDEPK
jgi:hypothetical protein